MKDIVGKKQLVKVTNAIKRDIEEGFGVLVWDYKVKKTIGDVSSCLYVYSSHDGYLTSTLVEMVQAIVGRYNVLYGACVFYGIDRLPDKNRGCVKINLMCI